MQLGKRTLVIIPTYNAKNSIVELISTILERISGIKILVVDHNSPEKTALLIKKHLTSSPTMSTNRILT